MAKNKRKLTTVAEIVEAFGGTKATADWADVGMPAVSNWLERDFIPPGWHYRMTIELGRRGFDVDPLVFGMRPAPEENNSRSREARRVA